MTAKARADLLVQMKDASRIKRSKCSVALLDDETRAAVEEAMRDTSITSTGISAVLRAAGLDVAHQAVQRHRRGVCSCEPRT